MDVASYVIRLITNMSRNSVHSGVLCSRLSNLVERYISYVSQHQLLSTRTSEILALAKSTLKETN